MRIILNAFNHDQPITDILNGFLSLKSIIARKVGGNLLPLFKD
jgi:hypothetical protein